MLSWCRLWGGASSDDCLVVHKDPNGVGIGVLQVRCPLLGIGCGLKDSE